METRNLNSWGKALGLAVGLWVCAVVAVCSQCEYEPELVVTVEAVERVETMEAKAGTPSERIQAEAVVAAANPLQGANVIQNCTITYYCTEPYDHICGNGDGLTALGTEIVPGHTVAVDTGVIPYGARVWIDYGDGVGQAYIAEDCGGGITGSHIDVAVETHEEAVAQGVAIATVYWRAD